MKFFSLTGWSDSGKTALITRLIQRFKERGKRVAAVKYTPGDYQIQPEGKDTQKFLEAGADDVLLITPTEMAHFQSRSATTPGTEELARQFPESDFVFLEGLYPLGVPVLEVFREQGSRSLKFPVDRLAALIGENLPPQTLPTFHPDDLDGIITFMEESNGS